MMGRGVGEGDGLGFERSEIEGSGGIFELGEGWEWAEMEVFPGYSSVTCHLVISLAWHVENFSLYGSNPS